MKPPRRKPAPEDDGPVQRSDPWWADQVEACVAHYWAWRRRQWLVDGEVPFPPAVTEMDAARELCMRRHDLDPLEAGPPAGYDIEGRPA